MANKKKRKNKAPHHRTPAPSERRHVVPSERRHVVSYDDIEGSPAPPVPRQKVSYASDINSDDENEQDQTPDQRHAVVSAEALRERERPCTDVTYGQQGAFPGLGPRDTKPFYGPANDGLDYLRMVRSEARGIPHIVSALDEPHEDDEADYGQDDYDEEYYDRDDQGWYEDGAYIAPTFGPEPPPTAADEALTTQDAYYESLKSRFESLRQRLRVPPSVQALHALDQHHPISLPFGNKTADKEWKSHLHNTTPLPAQLAAMDTASILRLLKLLEGQLENCRSKNIPHNISLWTWALLAKLEDVGLLQTKDVSVVRDLAKMAVWVRMMHHRAKFGRQSDEQFDEYYENGTEEGYEQDQESGAPAETLDDKSEVPDAEHGPEPVQADHAQLQSELAHEGDATDETATSGAQDLKEEGLVMELDSTSGLSGIIAAKKRQLEAQEAEPAKPEQEEEEEDEEFPDLNTRVTIDMLVTIAAEFYGQKDLLVGRLPWEFPNT